MDALSLHVELNRNRTVQVYRFNGRVLVDCYDSTDKPVAGDGYVWERTLSLPIRARRHATKALCGRTLPTACLRARVVHPGSQSLRPIPTTTSEYAPCMAQPEPTSDDAASTRSFTMKKGGKSVPRAEPIGVDARGKVRIYADVDESAAVELGVLAARKRITRKAMLELLIREAAAQKVGQK